MKKRKLLLLSIPTAVLPICISSSCESEEKQGTSKNVENLVKTYKKDITELVENYFPLYNEKLEKYESKNTASAALFDGWKANIIERIVDWKDENEKNEDILKNVFQNFADELADKKQTELVKDTFFDYSEGTQTYKAINALFSIFYDLKKQIKTNSEQMNKFINEKEDDKTFAFDILGRLKDETTIKTEEWQSCIEKDWKTITGSAIEFVDYKFVKKEDFSVELLKEYKTPTAGNMNHDHSHATYNMIYEATNYLYFFKNEIKKEFEKDKKIVSEKIEKLTDEHKDLKAKYEKLIDKLNTFFNYIQEEKNLETLYKTVTDIKTKGEEIRKKLVEIGKANNLTDSQIDHCFEHDHQGHGHE